MPTKEMGVWKLAPAYLIAVTKASTDTEAEFVSAEMFLCRDGKMHLFN